MNIKELIEKIKQKNDLKKLIVANLFVIIVLVGSSFYAINNIAPCKENSLIDTNKPLLLMIFSPSCPHCQAANTDIFTNLDILSKKYTLNPIYVGNIDSQKLHIIGVPTFILYKNGIEVKRAVGFLNTTTLIQDLEDK